MSDLQREVFVNASAQLPGWVCGRCHDEAHLYRHPVGGWTDFDSADFGCPCCFVEHEGPQNVDSTKNTKTGKVPEP